MIFRTLTRLRQKNHSYATGRTALKNKFFSVVVASVVALSIQSQASASPLTLDEVIKASVENSHGLKIRQSQITQAQAQLKQAENNRFGDLKFQAGYTRLSDVPEFIFDIGAIIPGVDIPPAPIIPVILDNYNLQLSATQPLFTGFALSNAEKAKEISLNAQKAYLERDEQSIEIQAAETYWNLYKIIQIEQAAQSSYKQLLENKENVKNLRDAGLATQADYLKMDVAVSEAKMMIIEAENGIKLTTINLNTMMNRPISEPIEILTTPEAPSANINNVPEIDNAIDARPDLKASNLMISAAEKGVEISEAAYWPSLSLGGNFMFNNPNQRIQPLVEEFNETWDIGIYLQYNITDIWKNDNKVQEAQTNKLMAMEQYEMQKDMLAVELSSAYLDVKKQVEKIENTRTTVEQARESRRITEEQYKSGLAIATDLIDTETSLLRAEINYNNAIADLQIAKAKLDYVAGKKIRK